MSRYININSQSSSLPIGDSTSGFIKTAGGYFNNTWVIVGSVILFAILIAPVFIEDKCYIDGGLSTNYPLQYCIESGNNLDEILGFKNHYTEDNDDTINLDSTLIQFLFRVYIAVNTIILRFAYAFITILQ